MKPVKLKVKDVFGDTVSMKLGSFDLCFSKRSKHLGKKEKFVEGEEWELTLKKVVKK